MKTISLNIDDAIFSETESVLEKVKKSRNRYINEAIAFYNKMQRRKYLAKQLQKESKMVRDESMRVLRDFENFEYDED